MFSTLAVVIGLAALLIVQRDRARARRRMLLRGIEDAAAQRATASQFSRT